MPVAITVTPPMGGEDFLFTLNAEQGSYIMLRGGRAKDDAMVHHLRHPRRIILGDTDRAVAAQEGIAQSSSPRLGQTPLVRLRQQGAGEQHGKIDQRHDGVHLQWTIGVGGDQRALIQQVRHSDRRHQ
jgi:hypothetical protein